MKETTVTHYYWLDALRFVAAFMVLFSHTRIFSFVPYGELPGQQQNVVAFIFYFIGRLGHEAVMIFFVLSGFLVGGRAIERIHRGNFLLSSYAIDRFTRITPPLVAAILFGIISYSIMGKPFSWKDALGNLFCMQGVFCGNFIPPLWSLNYEVWFYVFMGGFACLLSKKMRIKWCGYACVVSTFVIFIGGLEFRYFAIWLIGAAAYLSRPEKGNVAVLLTSIICLLCGIIAYQMSIDSNSIDSMFKIGNLGFVELWIAVFVGILIQQLVLLKPKKGITSFIERKLGSMAKFSYTLYLSHYVVLQWVYAFFFKEGSLEFTMRGVAACVGVLGLTLSVCYIIYLMSEKHTAAFRKWMKDLFCVGKT